MSASTPLVGRVAGQVRRRDWDGTKRVGRCVGGPRMGRSSNPRFLLIKHMPHPIKAVDGNPDIFPVPDGTGTRTEAETETRTRTRTRTRMRAVAVRAADTVPSYGIIRSTVQ